MKKILMLLTSSTVIFNPLFLKSCNLLKNAIYVEEENINVTNNIIDLDCNQPLIESSMIEITKEYNEFPTYNLEVQNKTWSDSISEQVSSHNISYELKKTLKSCSLKNLVKADEKAVEEFNEFISFSGYSSYDEIRNAVYKATRGKINFDQIINEIDIDKKRQEQFKEIILHLYNVLAKLVGKDSAAYLIFDLKVQSKLNSDKTLAVSIGFPDLSGNGGIAKSCIIYTKESLNVDKKILFSNYYGNMFWTTDSVFHPFIHEFGHIIDYYLNITPENRLKLKQGVTFANNSGVCQMEPSYSSVKNNIHKKQIKQIQNLFLLVQMILKNTYLPIFEIIIYQKMQ